AQADRSSRWPGRRPPTWAGSRANFRRPTRERRRSSTCVRTRRRLRAPRSRTAPPVLAKAFPSADAACARPPSARSRVERPQVDRAGLQTHGRLPARGSRACRRSDAWARARNRPCSRLRLRRCRRLERLDEFLASVVEPPPQRGFFAAQDLRHLLAGKPLEIVKDEGEALTFAQALERGFDTKTR